MNTIFKPATSFILCMFVFGSCHAYDQQRVIDNLSEDFADCTTYFNFIAGIATANHWEKIAADYAKSRDASLQMTTALMSKKPTGWLISKLEMKQQMMMEKFDSGGADGLTVTYKNFCKKLIEDPNSRILYWTNK